ncbi:MAG: DUF2723 domain-containing protein [Flavobacteriales bacterium]
MKKYALINNLSGWFAFAIAMFTYASTVEPTASFWDCGEFIATAYKLQIGHPPGAPLFMIMGRIATLFAFGDVTQVALMMNLFSALASALTILFLFWSITHLGRKIVMAKNEELSTGSIIAIMGSGLVGALAYTFSDTFWFSAVEGEVYATSSLFTAAVFWAMLKWEEVANEPQADRWIILIAYMMGLSIGVHLLNLLAIPAIAYIYYFKKYPTNTKGLILTGIIGMGILGLIQFGLIPGVVSIAAKFELLFTNGLGLPVGTGAFVYGALVVGLLIFGLKRTIEKGKIFWNTVLLCFTAMLLGYSSYGMILIRSNADTPMDENNPENVFTLLSYLNREQYGTRPLIYGQYFNAPLDSENPYKDGKTTYTLDKSAGKYIVVGDPKDNATPNYDSDFCTIFPRMWSSQQHHIRGYKEWGKIKGDLKKKPAFSENLRFFFSYQLGFMYWRYFSWNFVGRQNDIQGHGNILDGNWKSGFSFVDSPRLGTQHNLPDSMKNNKANNNFYFLPLILGLIGMFYHFFAEKKDATVVMLFFFFTGIAIILFLNQYTMEPRERDYGFAGSFYAFAIWIGLGVYAIYDLLGKAAPKPIAASVATVLSLVAVPYVMAKDGWDDHDRSHRYTARDYAANYLNSCAPNAILFTNGDNDTFPLWYAQEVEGIRTDVRVVNLSLLNTDWYIDQIKRKAYDSDPVPLSLTEDKYRSGRRDQVLFYEREELKGFQDVRKMVDFVSSDKQSNKLTLRNGKKIEYFPSNKFSVKVDSAKVIANGTVPTELADKIEKSINFTIDKSYVLKSELMILDLLATNNWERPIYFAITVGSDSYLGLEDYFQLEGLAYRLIPVKTSAFSMGDDYGRVNTNIMYDNVMNKFKWGGVDIREIYMDENNLRMTTNLRNQFDRLAAALIMEEKRDSAMKVVDKCFEVLPEMNIPFNYFVVPLAEKYYQLEAGEKGDAIMSRYAQILDDELTWFFAQKPEIRKSVQSTIQRNMAILKRIVDITDRYAREINKQIRERFKYFEPQYLPMAGSGMGRN